MDCALLIRPLTPSDRDTFFQLRLRGLQAHPESFGQSYEEALERGPAQFDAALQGSRAVEGDFIVGAFMRAAGAPETPHGIAPSGEIVGTVGLTRNQRMKERHKASVVGMYVAPEVAGRGVGRALLTELLGRAAQVQGLRQIQLMVSSTNEPARRLYESLGFRRYGREIEGLCVGGQLYDADLMALFL